MNRSPRVDRRYLLHARLLWRAAPAHSLACLVLTIVNAAASTVSLISTGQLVGALPDAIADGIGTPAATHAWLWFVVTAALFVASPVVYLATTALHQVASARYLRLTYDMLMEASTAPHGIAHLEGPSVAGRIDALKQALRSWRFVGASASPGRFSSPDSPASARSSSCWRGAGGRRSS